MSKLGQLQETEVESVRATSYQLAIRGKRIARCPYCFFGFGGLLVAGEACQPNRGIREALGKTMALNFKPDGLL
jgi:hypothetical protein